MILRLDKTPSFSEKTMFQNDIFEKQKVPVPQCGGYPTPELLEGALENWLLEFTANILGQSLLGTRWSPKSSNYF